MKKVLVITYYWPPAGGIAVHRCLNFARNLRSFGWEPIIYTAKNAQYPYYDDGNIKLIPDGITVLSHKITEPFSLFKKITGRKKNDSSNPVYARDKKVKWLDTFSIFVRSNFFIPDARALWIRPSVRYLSKYLKNNPVDAIITDGPPHTNTMIGYHLSKKFEIPWLADFQDPWTQVDYYKMLILTRCADRKHHRMEQKVFENADKITIVSPTWARDLESIGASDVDVIYWGYDENDYKELSYTPDTKFSMIHTGLLGFDRNPQVLLKVLGDKVKEDVDFRNDFVLKLAGTVDYTVLSEIKKNGLEDNMDYVGSVSREQALIMTFSAQILLLLLNKADNVQGRIPGKLFEYLRSRRPVLCLGPSNTDVGHILQEADAGVMYNYDDYNSLKKYIDSNYSKYKTNSLEVRKGTFENYSIQKQVEKISVFLNQISGK